MQKRIIVAAVAAALATPLAVNAEAIMYGQARVATQTHDREGLRGSWGLQDQASRLGVKGSEDLGGGLKGIYQMEFGVTIGDGEELNKDAGKGDATWTQRNSYVGLGTPFGTVLLGRHDTPFKMSTAKLDFFADTNVDNDTGFQSDKLRTDGVGLFDSNRVDGVIAYISPNLAGFTVTAAAVQGRAGRYNDGNVGGKYKFNTDAQDFAGAYSIADTYSNGPFYGAAAYEIMDLSVFNLQSSASPVYNKWRVGGGLLDFNGMSAAFIYEERDTDLPFGDTSSWQLSGAYQLPGMRLKGMYGQFDGVSKFHGSDTLEIDNVGSLDGDGASTFGIISGNKSPSFDTWALGIEYNLSKRTDVQLLYRIKTYDIAGKTSTHANGKSIDLSDNVFALQFDHSF